MKNTFLIFVLAVFMFVSCSDSNIKVTTTDSYHVVDFPDGSKAYVNKNSSLKYNKSFEQRIVTQKGEVFYSVTKGTSPFIVKTETGDITVLGTEFNVKSSSNQLEVEVEKGVVEIKASKFVKKINKGQKAFFKEVKHGIKTGRAEFKHKQWLKNLNKELKQLSKELKKETKEIGKELKKGLENL